MADRTVVYRLRADSQQFTAGMKAAGASVSDTANKMTAASKEGEKFRSGLSSLGGAAGKVGLVAAAGLGAAVMKAADFDSAMSKVQAATHESAAAMESLRQAALDAGAQTAFSATEAAAGIENLAKAGVSTADILNGGLAGALDLAAAGEMDVASAAEAAAGAMAQFKLEGDQVPHIADLMAAAAGKAQGEVSDMVMALKQGGTVAAQTGLSIEETTAAFAAMAEQSLLGSDAGTSFKTMLASLTPNSEKAAQAMERYNINAFDAQGNFVGMTELAGQLQAGLGDLTAEQRSMALETIFGSDAVRAASIIYDNGAEGIAEWTEKVNDAGYAAETAAIKQDNLRGDLEKLGGAFETALIGTGEGSQGPLRALVQSLEDAVNAYNELGEGAKSGVAVTLAATALIGGGLFVFSRAVQSIAATKVALAELGVTSQATAATMSTVLLPALAVVGGAVLANLAMDIGDVDYNLNSMNRQLELMAAQGDATGLLEDLSFGIDGVGEALRDAAYNDFAIFGEGAAEEIEELDKALAGLDPDVAAEAFKVLSEEGKAAGLSTKEITELFPEYNAELKLTAKEAEAAAGSLEMTAEQSGKLAEAAALSAAELKAQEAALEEARKAAQETASSFVNLGDGVDDAKVSLGQWIQQMANQADALNNFMDNAKRASKRGLRDGLINDLQDAGTAGALRMRQLSNATDEEIAKANRAWQRGQDAMQRYVNFKVPPKKVEVETQAALSAVASLEARLRAIRDEDVFVNVRHREYGRNTLGPVDRAEGGAVYGPGTATSDSIPAYLSNGEYVVKAAAVEKYGVHMFDRLNAMHFAEGGSVKKKRKRGMETVVDEETEAERAQREAEERRAEERAANQAAADERVRDAELERIEYEKELAEERDERDRAIAEEAERNARELAEAQYAGQQEAWKIATDRANDLVEDAKRAVDAVEQNMDRIGQAATSAFGGSWFGGSGGTQQRGLWVGANQGPQGDWRSKAMSDISGLQERSGLIQQLAGLGLSGAALEDLLGNQSNAGISAMIQAGEIGEFAALFGQRASLMESVGQQAGQAGYGGEMAVANAHLAEMSSRFAAIEAAITAARPITVLEAVSAEATARELARLLSVAGGA